MRKLIVAFAASLALAQFSTEALAQQGAAWAGWARCEVRVQGPGYNDQQTHTWTITGGAPAVQGAFQIYTGTWAVVGGGSLSRSQGTQTLMAQWATNGPGVSAPIAVFVRASDNRMFIQARHAQMRSNSAIQGYQQVTIAGRPQTPARIDAAAFEWAFPVIAVSAPVAPDRNATAAGSSTSPVNGSVGLMQPAGSQGTASCTWQFGQGSAAPAPPHALAAQAIPTPGGPATTTPPANNPPVASTPPGNSTPPSTPPGTTTPPDNPPGSTTAPVSSARLIGVSHTALEQGAIGTVMTLTGQGTHWSQSRPSVVVAPDIGVTVTNAQATSDTELLVALDVQYATAPGPRTITVTAGSEVVTLSPAFTVTARARPELVTVTPLRARQGDRNLTVQMTGRNTRWAQGATRVQVARAVDASQPGTAAQMPGVTVVSTTVHSPTSASAVLNVEADAVPGAYWFQVFDAAPSDWLKIVDGFTVEAAAAAPPVTAVAVPIGPGVIPLAQFAPLMIVTPNGGETWAAGQERYVGWKHNLGAQQLFDVEVSVDRGTTWTPQWQTLKPNSVPHLGAGVVGTFVVLPTTLTTGALLRVKVAGQSAPFDLSDGAFNLVQPIVNVTRPAAGERWAIGATGLSIALTHNLWPQAAFAVELSRDGGATWASIGQHNQTYPFVWRAVTGPATTRARIRVVPMHGGRPGFENPFIYVAAESPEFTIAAP